MKEENYVRKCHGSNNALLGVSSNEDVENENRMTENCTDRKLDRFVDLFLLYVPTTSATQAAHGRVTGLTF
jgi:hypothetical protein